MMNPELNLARPRNWEASYFGKLNVRKSNNIQDINSGTHPKKHTPPKTPIAVLWSSVCECPAASSMIPCIKAMVALINMNTIEAI